MKKITGYLMLSAIGISLCIFNVFLSKPYKNVSDSRSNLQLVNIQAMRASAGEQWCDALNQTTCVLVIGGQRGVGTGTAHGY